jgi:hypothetical protein
MPSPLKEALRLAALGWPVLPVALGKKGDKVTKTPLLSAWQRRASTDEAEVRAMAWAKAGAVGIALPVGTMALDVDDVDAFEASGLEVPETHGQVTQSKGYHRLYRTDGRPVRQTVRELAGADTRVGGHGFVVAWERWDFRPEDLAAAPEWLYAPKAEPATRDAAPGGNNPLGTRSELIALAGSLRASGLEREDIYNVLARMANDGRIVDLDPTNPWTAQDLKVIATEAGKWARGEVLPAPVVRKARRGSVGRVSASAESTLDKAPPRTWTARELLETEMPPLAWAIPGILPEGTTVLAARPKIGKSWLAYQTSIAVALGSMVLGQRARPGSALYLALEDGPRRGKSRLEALLAQTGLRAVPEGLEVAFEWPRMGAGCEEEITAWLDGHPDAVVVWVDTLARIRPKSSGRRGVYEVDYEDMSSLQRIVVDRGVSLGIVHHDRKAESDDFLEQVSGSHGITGAADTVMVLKRARHSPDAVLSITGRDIEERALALARNGPAWELSNKPLADGTTLENSLVLAIRAIIGRGDRATTSAIVAELGLEPRPSAEYMAMKANLQDKRAAGLLSGDGKAGYTEALAAPSVRFTRNDALTHDLSPHSPSYSEHSPSEPSTPPPPEGELPISRGSRGTIIGRTHARHAHVQGSEGRRNVR